MAVVNRLVEPRVRDLDAKAIGGVSPDATIIASLLWERFDLISRAYGLRCRVEEALAGGDIETLRAGFAEWLTATGPAFSETAELPTIRNPSKRRAMA